MDGERGQRAAHVAGRPGELEAAGELFFPSRLISSVGHTWSSCLVARPQSTMRATSRTLAASEGSAEAQGDGSSARTSAAVEGGRTARGVNQPLDRQKLSKNAKAERIRNMRQASWIFR